MKYEQQKQLFLNVRRFMLNAWLLICWVFFFSRWFISISLCNIIKKYKYAHVCIAWKSAVVLSSFYFSFPMLNVYQSKDKNNLILCIIATPLIILMLMSLNIYHLLTTLFHLIVHIVRLDTKAQGQINIVNLVLSSVSFMIAFLNDLFC